MARTTRSIVDDTSSIDAQTLSSAGQDLSASASAASGFPDGSNTGVPAGTALTSYSGTLHVTQDNAVISNMLITGNVIIDADNVTLKNCKIISTNDWLGVSVKGDAKNFTMQDSEVDGRGTTATAVQGKGTFLRNDIHGAENGIDVPGGDGPTLIKDNYIHGLQNTGSPHYDGIQIDGAHDVTITHNTVINDHGQTAAIMLDNYWEGLYNITVDNNRLVGGGFTIYLDDRFDGGPVDDSTIKIINNQVGGGGYGDYAFYGNNPVFYGNVGLDEIPGDGGGSTDVTIDGTAGNDVLPDSGQDNGGDETFNGLGGNDILKGGAGADKLNGGNGSDTANYDGSDVGVSVNLQTGKGSGGHAAGDILAGIENLTGSSRADTLTGNAANNLLDGGAAADKLAGGAGNDTYVVDNIGDFVTEASNAGNDYVRAFVSYTLGANIENIGLAGTGNISATGNALANKIIGNAAANTLLGGTGADQLTGGGGADIITGGSDADILTGDAGIDVLTGGRGSDRFVFEENALSNAAADRITDFDSKDLIAFDADGSERQLSSRSFVSGASARDADDHFVFDSSTNSLYYDADGSGAGDKTLVATFDDEIRITASDILLL